MQTKNVKKYLQEIFDDRLGISDLKPILEQVSVDYNLGKLQNFTLNEYGFQDVNVEIVTETGKYFVKIFSRDNTKKRVVSYVNLMEIVSISKVSYPALLKGTQGYFYTVLSDQTPLRLCVQQFINGKNLHKTGMTPTIKDFQSIAKEAAFLNSIDFKPDFIELDTWATLKFPEVFPVKKEALTDQELSLVEPLLKDFSQLSITSLPKCLVHGDIIRTNILKDEKGKIWLIDLGVANWQARIVEIAVMAHDLFLDLASAKKTKKLRQLMLEEYQKVIKLKPEELDILPTLIKITHAMYLLSAAFMERTLGHGNAETAFWLNQSKEALKNIENNKILDKY